MTLRKMFTAVALSTLAVATTPASATTFSSLIVFGDSLVDSGNAQIGSILNNLPDPAPAAAGYASGRFSNGANFADYLNVGINGSLATAYLQGGANFAVGGALAAYKPGGIIPSFVEQLAIFGSLNQPISSTALVLVTFGGNDVRATIGVNGTPDFSASVSALQTGLAALISAGARNIVVTGVPDIGDLPGTRAAAPGARRSDHSRDQHRAIDRVGPSVQYYDRSGRRGLRGERPVFRPARTRDAIDQRSDGVRASVNADPQYVVHCCGRGCARLRWLSVFRQHPSDDADSRDHRVADRATGGCARACDVGDAAVRVCRDRRCDAPDASHSNRRLVTLSGVCAVRRNWPGDRAAVSIRFDVAIGVVVDEAAIVRYERRRRDRSLIDCGDSPHRRAACGPR